MSNYRPSKPQTCLPGTRPLDRVLRTELLDAAVVTTGTEAYRRRDGIGVIPAALLTA